MRTLSIKAPVSAKDAEAMKAGDKILLSGTVLVARDQAHLRLIELMKEGKPLPVDLKGQVVYYAGPTRPGEVVGSVGPTTATRMDKVAEPLFEKGVTITIGKGERGKEFQDMVVKYKAPYLAAMGGSGAVVQQSVVSSKVLAFPEMGPEAIYELTVKDMPVYVAYDVHGESIYKYQ